MQLKMSMLFLLFQISLVTVAPLALIASPSDSTKVVFENNNVKILLVDVRPGDLEKGLVQPSRGAIWFADVATPAKPPKTAYRVEFKKPFVTAATAAPAQDPLDAVKAAPANHHVVFEDDNVRVLLVTGMAGEKEKIHTHRWPSVIWFTQPVPLTNYRYQLDGEHTFRVTDSLVQSSSPPANRGFPLEPEGPHSIQNTGTIEGIGYRIEFKSAFAP